MDELSDLFSRIEVGISNGADDIVTRMIERNNFERYGGANKVLWEAVKQDRVDIVMALIRGGMDPNIVDGYGTSLLDTAIINNSVKSVEALLKVARLSEGSTNDLIMSCMSGNARMIEVLLQASKNPEQEMEGAPRGWTALHCVIIDFHRDNDSINRLDCIRILIHYGAFINTVASEWAPISNGGTLLYRAVKLGLIHLVNLLLEKGADMSIPAPNGDIPMHLAARLAKKFYNHETRVFDGNGHIQLDIFMALYRHHHNKVGVTDEALLDEVLGGLSRFTL